MTKTCAVSGGRPSRFVTIGRPMLVSNADAVDAVEREENHGAGEKQRTASPRYHRTLHERPGEDFFFMVGRRMGGSSMMNPTAHPQQHAGEPANQEHLQHDDADEREERGRTRRRPECREWSRGAEQGMLSASSRIAISRSFGVDRILVVIVAMVSQPSLSTIGNTALPLSPIARNMRSVKTARRGMYPLSSRKPNSSGRTSLTGNTMAMV